MGQKKEDAEEEVEQEELIELITLAPLAEVPDLLISQSCNIIHFNVVYVKGHTF